VLLALLLIAPLLALALLRSGSLRESVRALDADRAFHHVRFDQDGALVARSQVNLETLPASKKYFMLTAAEEASKSVLREKHGCVIVRGREILARGHNKHVVKAVRGRISCHAEKDAILKCRKQRLDLRDADLYVVRWGTRESSPSKMACELSIHRVNNDNLLSGKNVPGNPVIMYSAPCSACVALIRACMKK